MLIFSRSTVCSVCSAGRAEQSLFFRCGGTTQPSLTQRPKPSLKCSAVRLGTTFVSMVSTRSGQSGRPWARNRGRNEERSESAGGRKPRVPLAAGKHN